MTYFHGGVRGLRVGDYLLPPDSTGARSCSEFGGAGVHRNDRVYITPSPEAALLYAAGQDRGVVYQCMPVGDIEPDPDCTMPGLSWQCEKARIVKVIKPKTKHLLRARKVLLEGN
ncbi:MAG: hypothetical protein ABFE07_25340 [Armatimonadia bacterium]